MTNLGLGTADEGGAFVKDLASELSKAPATLVAYLKKHLPATITKRKNANNRLANFVTEEGVAGLRSHYAPSVAADSFFCDELQRLREENARLRARVQELEAAVEQVDSQAKINPMLVKYRASQMSKQNLRELVEKQELAVANVERAALDLPTLSLEQYKEITNVKPKLFSKEYYADRARAKKTIAEYTTEASDVIDYQESNSRLKEEFDSTLKSLEETQKQYHELFTRPITRVQRARRADESQERKVIQFVPRDNA